MIQTIIQLVVGLLGGASAGLQVPFAGIMGQKVGDFGSVFFTYVGGLLLITILVLITGQHSLGDWREIPWYAYMTGPCGVVIVGSFSYAAPRLGITTTTVLNVLAWLVVSALVDHFGWFNTTIRPIDWPRLLGLLAVAAGTWLVVR